MEIGTSQPQKVGLSANNSPHTHCRRLPGQQRPTRATSANRTNKALISSNRLTYAPPQHSLNYTFQPSPHFAIVSSFYRYCCSTITAERLFNSSGTRRYSTNTIARFDFTLPAHDHDHDSSTGFTTIKDVQSRNGCL